MRKIYLLIILMLCISGTIVNGQTDPDIGDIDNYVITIKSSKNTGVWIFKFDVPDQSKDKIWIDWNDNGLKDADEILLNYEEFKHERTSDHLTIHGSLKKVIGAENDITEIDLTRCPTITYIDLTSNHIKSLDISHQEGLQYLFCSDNEISEIDLSKNVKLKSLLIQINKIKKIDVSNNKSLKTFNCSLNDISELNVHNNSKISWIACYSNHIDGENMDKLVESLHPISEEYNEGELYVIDTKDSLDKNICYNESVAKAKKKHWNIYDFQGYANYGKNPYDGSAYEAIKCLRYPKELIAKKSGENIIIITPDSLVGRPLFIYNLKGQPIYTVSRCTKIIELNKYLLEGIFIISVGNENLKMLNL